MPSQAAEPGTWAQRIAWTMLALTLVLVSGFVAVTSRLLPASVAVRFDESGYATSWMSFGGYSGLIWSLAVALPLAVVLVANVAYSRARGLRLPQREYWMAPARIAATRAFLKAHITWLGVLLATLMGFMHWLIVSANALQPPRLATQVLLIGALMLLLCMAAWIAALSLRFRRPL